jgi:4-amino-4-deoxy-L-arabinose transferase-like glycosyltransferase
MKINSTFPRFPLSIFTGQVLGLGVDGACIVAAGMICILGLVVRFVTLTYYSLDGDEFASYYFAHFSFWQLWTEELDTHPPLYCSIEKIILVFGDSEALLRTPVALLGSGAVLLTYLLARRIVSGPAALLAAALMAISPGQIYFSQFARSYALLTVAALGTALTVVGIFNNYTKATLSTWGQRALYVLSLTIALYTHNIAFLLFAITAFFGLVAIVAGRSTKCFLEWVALNGAILLLWWWWLIVVVDQAEAGLINLQWLAPPTLSFIGNSLASAYGVMFILHFRSLIDIITLVAVGIALIAAGIMVTRCVLGKIPLAYLLALVVCTPAAEIAISLMWRPIFYYRVIMWTVPFFYILAALVITSLRSSRAVGVLVSGIAAIFILDMWAHYRKPVSEDYRTLVDDVYAASRDGDVIVTMHPWVHSGINYYLAQHLRRAVTVVDRSNSLMRSVSHLPPASVVHLPPSADRVWLIGGSVREGDPELSEDLASYRLVRRYDEHDVSAELYQRPRAAQ